MVFEEKRVCVSGQEGRKKGCRQRQVLLAVGQSRKLQSFLWCSLFSAHHQESCSSVTENENVVGRRGMDENSLK